MKKNSFTRREFLGKTSAGLAAASVVARGSAAVTGKPSSSGFNGSAAVTGNPNALAMQGGTPVRTTPFPHWPHHEAIDEEYVMKTLKNERWCSYDG